MSDQQPEIQLALPVSADVAEELRQLKQAAIDLAYRAGVLERRADILAAAVQGRSQV